MIRAGFGLVGILVCVGVLVWLLGPGGGLDHQRNVIKIGEQAKSQASQFAGQDYEAGGPARNSATVQLETNNGRTDSIFVAAVKPGGAYERYWGLQRKDSILELGPLPVRGLITSKDDAEIFLQDAYQKLQPIVVMRDGKKITLPLTKPGEKPASPGDSLQSQLDAIQKSAR